MPTCNEDRLASVCISSHRQTHPTQTAFYSSRIPTEAPTPLSSISTGPLPPETIQVPDGKRGRTDEEELEEQEEEDDHDDEEDEQEEVAEDEEEEGGRAHAPPVRCLRPLPLLRTDLASPVNGALQVPPRTHFAVPVPRVSLILCFGSAN